MKEGNHDPLVPLWKLERFLIGELPPEEMARIEKLRSENADVAEWIRALQAEHADLQASHPTGMMAGRIWKKLKAEQGGMEAKGVDDGAGWPGMLRRMRAAATGPGKAILVPIVGLALLLTLMPNRFSCSTSGDAVDLALGTPGSKGLEDTRLKGSAPALFLYRKTGAGAEPIIPGSLAHPGDLIQVHYDGAGRKYGAIFSLDGRNHITWHLPENGRQAALLAAGKTPLATAFELDETPGREDFHFLASDAPFSPDSLAAAMAEGVGNLAMPDSPPSDSLQPVSQFRVSHTVFALTKGNLK